MTSIEFTIPAKADDKELIPSVGEMEGNTWHGEAAEVQFTSTYTSSWPESNANKHIQIAEVKVTVVSPTGIIAVNNRQRPIGNAVYTISGVRVDGDHLPRGIYIKNGKKFIIK
jgi:hypothetical protein